MRLRRLEDLDLAGKTVFLRLDLNVPIKSGQITDDTRIKAALPTLEYILEHTNKLVVSTHLGRPKGAKDPAYSVEPVGKRLAELLHKDVVFIEDYVEEPVENVLRQLDNNQFILLENLRFHKGETANDPAFARTLMKGIDYYVNDAFGTVHRAHASVVACAESLKPEARAAGFLVEKEINALAPMLKNPEAPFTVVMGGAKVSDKIAVMLSLLTKCNNLLVGGAMAYTFMKFQGIKTGSSRIEEDKFDLVKMILANAEERKVKIYLPSDHICGKEFVEGVEPVLCKGDIPDGFMGLDIGPETAEKYAQVIKNSKTVLWNGPMGVFEWPAFAKGTLAVAKAMAECNGNTVIGGGDSAAAANKAGIAEKVKHISTGGGASIEYLEGKVLPGVKVLMQ